MGYIPKKLEKTADISRGRKPLRRIFEYAIGLAVFSIAVYLLLGLVAHLLASLMPDSWEEKLSFGFSGFEEIEEGKERVEPLLDRLIQNLDTRDLPFRVRVVEMEQPNAFATPGGAIWVTSELLRAVPDDAELAFVLAHELGHHHHRHVVKRMGRSVIFGLVGALLFGGDSFGPGSALVQLAELDYSRMQELEADAFAQELMTIRFPESPNAYQVLAKLGAEHPDFLGSGYLLTHPHPKERLERLEARTIGE